MPMGERPSGLGADQTVAATDVDMPTRASSGDWSLRDALVAGGGAELETRFRIGGLLGRGGMGDVVTGHDRRLGRDVAIKRMRREQPSPDELSRFVREARVQGGLEHPSIVPVYDFGVDREGHPYLVMKRLTGITLHDHLDRLAEATGDAQETLRVKLLRAFTDVCLAVEYAHSRGVVHRDLKPANIMLGEFGETYVIDWGVAHASEQWRKELDAEPVRPTPHPRPQPTTGEAFRETVLSGDEPNATREGAVMGTPAYMAPEQLMGGTVTAASDIYALGAILFEIVCSDYLHEEKRDPLAALDPVDARPSRVRPDAPPELDAICARAAHVEADRRFPSARALGDAVQQFLDGHRDTALRREVALRHLATAREAVASGDPARTADAIRAAGRALAFDPDNAEVASLVTSLLVEPPREYPAALVAELDRAEAVQTAARLRRGAAAFMSPLLLWAVIPFLAIKSWGWLAAFFGVLVLLIGQSLRSAKEGKVLLIPALVSNLAGAVMWSRLFSPFLLTPVMICGVLLAIVAVPWMTQRTWAVLAWIVAMVMLPIVLEWLGILGSTWEVKGGALVTTSAVFEIRGSLEVGLLIGLDLFFVIVVGLFALAIRRTTAAAQRAVNVQAWQLRQLVDR